MDPPGVKRTLDVGGSPELKDEVQQIAEKLNINTTTVLSK
jgi:hypothetical protein